MDKKIRIWLILAILIIGAFYLLTLREGHEWGDDFSAYIHHAKNIAEGVNYRHIGYIYNPSAHIGPQTYPPIFPLLLAPVYKWFGLNLTAMKINIILAFLLSLFVIFLVFRNDLPWPYLISLIAVLGFNPYFWEFKDSIVSDLPFLLFTYLSLFFLCRAYQLNQVGLHRALDVLLISLLVYLAYGTRSIGLVLIPCLLVYDIVKHKRLTAFAIKIACLTVTFIILQNIFLHSDSSYVDSLELSLNAVLYNLLDYLRALSMIWENGYSKAFRITLFAAISGLAIIAYAARIRAQITYFEIFMALYLISIIVVPIQGGTRYLIPVIPLYLFYAFLGIKVVAHRKQTESLVFITVIVAIAVTYTAQYTRLDYGPIREGIAKNETRQFFDYVKQEIGENDVLIFRKPRALALFTGKRAAWHQSQDDQDLWNYLEQIHATHIVLGPKNVRPTEQAFLSHFIDKYETQFQEVYANADFKVYRIKAML